MERGRNESQSSGALRFIDASPGDPKQNLTFTCDNLTRLAALRRGKASYLRREKWVQCGVVTVLEQDTTRRNAVGRRDTKLVNISRSSGMTPWCPGRAAGPATKESLGYSSKTGAPRQAISNSEIAIQETFRAESCRGTSGDRRCICQSK